MTIRTNRKKKPVPIHWWDTDHRMVSTAEMFEGTIDLEFEETRKFAEMERVAPQDRTMIGGVPTEWIREEAVREMLMADGRIQDIPMEWLVALDQTDDIRNMK